mmetsp:Transcript_2396/g.10256  ORF Transcript_2396/g.10256 Transcript_2396/m.10256 type:complete len:245 (-) Transcript_2396:1441-2175(-)
MPNDSRMRPISVRMDLPLIRASPPVALRVPVSMLIVVVFPAPLCPRSAETWPGTKVTVRSSTATTPLLNCFFKPRILTDALRSWSSVRGSMFSPSSVVSLPVALSSSTLCDSPSQYSLVNGKSGLSFWPNSVGQTLSRYHVISAYNTQSRNTMPMTDAAEKSPYLFRCLSAVSNVIPSFASSRLASMCPHMLMEEPGSRQVASQPVLPCGDTMRTAIAGAMDVTYTKHPTTLAVMLRLNTVDIM